MPDSTAISSSRSASTSCSRGSLTISSGVTAAAEANAPRSGLQRSQERDQVVLLLLRKANPEALVVEIDDGGQIVGRAVVEIRCPTRECAQDGPFEAPDVLPATGDERAPRIGRLDRPQRLLVAQCVER